MVVGNLRAAFICGALATGLATLVELSSATSSFWGQWIGAVLLGFGLAWTTVQIRSVALKTVVAAVALVEAAVLSWLLQLGGIHWSPWTALLSGTLAFGFGLEYSVSKLGRRKRAIEQMFGGRTSRGTLQKILESKNEIPVAGEKCDASVVDCQLVNACELAGNLCAPDFVALCNAFSQTAAQALMGAGGVLIEGNGARLRAVFGAPLAHAAAATEADAATRELEERLKAFRETCHAKWKAEPVFEVAVQSGPMIAGSFGIEPLGGFGVLPTTGASQ